MRIRPMIHLLLLALSLLAVPAHAAGDDWIVGTWKQVYDPKVKEVDSLEFTADGNVISRSSVGTYTGFYMVAPDMVKAVLAVGSKDLILTFFYNANKNQLRIVTDQSGIETVYQKVDNE